MVKIDLSRDSLITPEGMATLRTSYMLPDETSPQQAFARAAEAFSSNDAHAQRMYDYVSRHWCMYATPTLANANRGGGLPISCELNYVGDSRREIMYHVKENTFLASEGGGIGGYWGHLRGLGTKTSKGAKSGGIMPWLKLIDAQIEAVNQTGVRKASYCAYLDDSHPEIEEFLSMRKPTGGDLNRKCLNLHHGVNLSDEFMQRVEALSSGFYNGVALTADLFDTLDQWQLIDPHSKQVTKTVSVMALWESIISIRQQTGEPYLHFVDTSNTGLKPWLRDLGLRIHHSNLCLTGDMRLLTARGYQTMRELWEQSGRQELTQEVAQLAATVEDRARGCYSPSVDQFGELRIVNPDGEVSATNVYRTGEQVPVYEIELHSGHRIRATSQHRFVVHGQSEGVALHDLRIGQSLALTRVRFFGTRSDIDYALLAGWVIGDGSVSTCKKSGQQRAHVRVFHRDLEEGVCEALQSSMQVVAQAHNRSGGGSLGEFEFNPRTVKGFGFERAEAVSSVLGRLLRDDDIVPGHKHAVPNSVWLGDRNTVAAFLRGLFSADGSAQCYGKAGSVKIGSTSRELLAEVQLLLSQFDIGCRVYARGGAKSQAMNDGRGGLKDYDRKPFFELSISSRDNLIKFMEIGFLQPYKNDILGDYLSRTAGSNNSSTKSASEIVSITYAGTEDVYCLTQPDSHRIEVNGISTFQCSEITLVSGHDRTAVCCLLSPNAEYFDEWSQDPLFLRDIAEFLDNVLQYFIDHAPEELWRAINSARRERSIGIGLMGFHSYLQSKNIPFESALAQSVNRKIFTHMREKIDAANRALAIERGEAPDAMGHGVRFSYTMALAPNASSSKICGNTSPSTEQYAANAYLSKSEAGSYIAKNKHLVRVLREYGRDNDDTWRSIIAREGSVQHFDWMSEWHRDVFKTAFETDAMWYIQHAADRQPSIDQAQSLNLYLRPTINWRDAHALLLTAWKRGLKSVYYCRSISVKVADQISQVSQRREMAVGSAAEQTERYSECLGCQG